MIFEMTVQVRVTNIEEGLRWYETLLSRKPDFIPHDGFLEWEVVPGCWLQVAEGLPALGSGPLRFGVKDIKEERKRLIRELNIEEFELFSRKEVPVKWGSFNDPWGNIIGLFEYISKKEEDERIETILGKLKVK